MAATISGSVTPDASGTRPLRNLALGWSVGLGGAATLAVEFALRLPAQDRSALIAIVGSWGPMFATVVLGAFLVIRLIGVVERGTERHAASGERMATASEQLVQSLAEGAASQRRLAEAVEQSCSRDDVRAQQMVLEINYLSASSRGLDEKIDKRFSAVDNKIDDLGALVLRAIRGQRGDGEL